jgi:hypothetical protein
MLIPTEGRIVLCILLVFTSVLHAVQLCAERIGVLVDAPESLMSWKVLSHTNNFVMISFVLLLIQGHVCCDRTRMDSLP